MTELIVIDESGDLGSRGTRYFINSAIIAESYGALKPILKYVENKKFEKKFHNSADNERIMILNALTKMPVVISYVATRKNNPLNHKLLYGKELYKRTLFDLTKYSTSILNWSGVNIIVDSNSFIDQCDLRASAEKICQTNSKIAKICRKGISQNEPCIRLADYVAGAIKSKLEYKDDRFYNIIEEKVAVARKY